MVGGGGSRGTKYSAQYPHNMFCVCAAQETEKAAGVTLIQMTLFQPDQLPHVERKILQDDPPPIQATMTVPEWNPEP